MKSLAFILSFCMLALAGAGHLEFRDSPTSMITCGSCCTDKGSCSSDHGSCCDDDAAGDDDAAKDDQECFPGCSCNDIGLVAGLEIHFPEAPGISYQVIHYPFLDEHYTPGYPRHLLQPPRCV